MVTTAYVDTSAAMKLIVDEAESASLLVELTAPGRRLVSSWLLHTELHCAAGRHPGVLSLASIRTVLDAVALVDVTRGDLLAAGTHAPLRSHDAIHLAMALRIGADEVVTYDAELAEAVAAAGMRVLAPA
jgi:uncharacterized protein